MATPLNSISIRTIAPLTTFFMVLLAWELSVRWLGVPEYLLPGPIKVANAGWAISGRLTEATLLTAAAACCGFVLALLVGVATSVAFSQSAWIRTSCYPYAIFLQTVPIVAIAPLVITWFDYGFHSVVVISFVLSLFPVIANATSGMVELDPLLLDLFQLHNASRWQLLLKLRLPSAVPHIVVGAKTSCGLAVVGAIVGEFFVGPGMDRCGLGSLIQQKLAQLRTDEAFAALFASTALSVGIFALVSYAGKNIMDRWYNSGCAR